MLPSFIVIGAQKCGTTSLWSYLDGHPEVFVAREKEPKFFVAERGWRRGVEWYESLFAEAAGAKARGECSTDYTAFPVYDGVAARMAALVPEARLIYLMRNPIERIRSAYAYALRTGVESRPIGEAVLHDARYLNQSRYALQIDQYLPHFPLSQLLFVKAEDLRHRRTETLRAVFSFIGVDPDVVPPNVGAELNVGEEITRPRPWARRLGDVLARTGAGLSIPQRLGRYVGRVAGSPLARAPVGAEEVEIGPELRGRLVAYLRSDLEALRELVGPDFDCWGLLDGRQAP